MKQSVPRDVLALFGIILIASGVGILVNAARHTPLALKYAGPAPRATRATSSTSIPMIGLDEMKTIVGRADVVIIDARPSVFFQAAHISGAISVPRDAFDAEFLKQKASLSRPGIAGIVVYCSGGDCEDSGTVAGKLQQAGIGPLAIYEGGWDEWSAETLSQK